ncbi:MAG: septum formation initiator family protein [Firmicutes bacterium]|nr:septum formation initiator family protein [Bacillota bacterium]
MIIMKKKKFKLRYVLFLALIIYLGTVFIKQEMTINSLEKKNETKQKEVKELNGEISEIEKQLEKVNSLEFIEKVAREELKMVKPNEIIYIDKNKEDKEDNNNFTTE